MKTLAIFNLKGGVGKTMTTAAMADCLVADYKKHVLLIDADAQGNLSQYFGVEAEDGGDLLALLEGKNEAYYPDFVSHARAGIDIIPAGMRLMYADLAALTNGRCNLHAIEDLRETLAEDAAYDYLLIDCPPAFSAASSAALTAADAVIIPIRLDAFSTAGMAELITQVSAMRQINDRLRVSGMLATQYQRTAEELAALALLTAQGVLPVYQTRIRHSPRVSASTFSGESLSSFSPHCGAAKDYRRFVKEFLEREENGNG